MQRPVWEEASVRWPPGDRTGRHYTYHFRAIWGLRLWWDGSLQFGLEGVDLLAEDEVLLLCLLYADLELGKVLCLAGAVVALLEKRARGRDRHVLSAAARHGCVWVDGCAGV